MPQEYSRSQRIGDLLQRELAVLVQNLSDPRLELISITGVDLSKDLSHARVHFTMLNCDSDADMERTTSVLNRAAGFLRKGLSKATDLRSVPKIRFYFDSSISRARNINALIHEANASKGKHIKSKLNLGDS